MRREIFKLGFVMAFIIAGITACQEEMSESLLFSTQENSDLMLMSAPAETNVASAPVSAGCVTPYIILGESPGGNRTCEEVAVAFGIDGFEFSSDKVDYNGSFSGGFPEGLTVTTNGTYVYFSYESDKYCVGAVIVKGSNDANVYFYEGGVKSDWGLASPLNASGKPAGLSNITFCFVECETPPPPPTCEWVGETAFGGATPGEGSAWWFAFDTHDEDAEQPIYAGQKMVEGASVEYDADNDIITINLGPNMQLNLVSYNRRTGVKSENKEPVKVQGYDELPDSRPAAGLFTTYKGKELTIQGDDSRYYVIHLDVEVLVCEEDEY